MSFIDKTKLQALNLSNPVNNIEVGNDNTLLGENESTFLNLNKSISNATRDSKNTIPLLNTNDTKENYNFRPMAWRDLESILSFIKDPKKHDEIANFITQLKDPKSDASKWLDKYQDPGLTKDAFRENVIKILSLIVKEMRKGNPGILNKDGTLDLWHLATAGDINKIEPSDFKAIDMDVEDLDFPGIDGEKEVEANKLRRELFDYISKSTGAKLSKGTMDWIDRTLMQKHHYSQMIKDKDGNIIGIITNFQPPGERFADGVMFSLSHQGNSNGDLPEFFKEHLAEKFEALNKLLHNDYKDDPEYL